MNEALKNRIQRRLEGLPEAQLYPRIDYTEFLESRYNRGMAPDAYPLQKMADTLEGSLRKGNLNHANLSEAFQLISTADRILASVSAGGRQFLDDLQPPPSEPPQSEAAGSREAAAAEIPSDEKGRAP